MGKSCGSITVEMTLIMITSLGITFMIMMTGMYLWDMNRLQTLSERYVLQVAEARGEYWKRGTTEKNWELWDISSSLGKEPEEWDELWLEEGFRSRISQGFFYLDKVDVKADINGDRVSLRVSGEWSCPLQMLFIEDSFSFDFTTTRSCKNKELLLIVHGVLRGLGG